MNYMSIPLLLPIKPCAGVVGRAHTDIGALGTIREAFFTPISDTSFHGN